MVVSLEIEWNDGLEHCLTTSRAKTHEKNLGPQIGSEIRLFAILSRLHQKFSLTFCKIAVRENV